MLFFFLKKVQPKNYLGVLVFVTPSYCVYTLTHMCVRTSIEEEYFSCPMGKI